MTNTNYQILANSGIVISAVQMSMVAKFAMSLLVGGAVPAADALRLTLFPKELGLGPAEFNNYAETMGVNETRAVTHGENSQYGVKNYTITRIADQDADHKRLKVTFTGRADGKKKKGDPAECSMTLTMGTKDQEQVPKIFEKVIREEIGGVHQSDDESSAEVQSVEEESPLQVKTLSAESTELHAETPLSA